MPSLPDSSVATTTTTTAPRPARLKSVVSASALYPFKGIYYFLSHREYYPLFGRRLIPLTIVSILVLSTLFTFAYLPQAIFLLAFHGPTAWISAVFLVLGEGQVVVALLFEAFMIDETLVDVFDATLIREGQKSLIAPSRILFPDAPTAVKQLGKPTSSAVYSPFSFRQIAEFVLFLPLNLIPVIGTPFFLLLTGARGGPLHHWRYFQLRGLDKKERNREIYTRRWKYTWFGTVALFLQLLPVLSMFFLLTTACGSALWVARLEEQKTIVAAGAGGIDTAARRVEVGDDEAPPAYTDNPV